MNRQSAFKHTHTLIYIHDARPTDALMWLDDGTFVTETALKQGLPSIIEGQLRSFTIMRREDCPPRCSYPQCRTPEDRIVYAPDPYALEIRGDDTRVWMCCACRDLRSLEV